MVARALLIALGLAFAASLVSGSGSTALDGRLGGDYPAFYGAGSLVRDGVRDQLYDPARQEAAQQGLFGSETEGYLHFAYPPVVAAFYAPFAALPYRTSYALHTLLMVGALVGALWAVRPMVRVVDRNPVAALAAALCFYPMFRAVTAGQNTALTLLLIALSWRAVHEDRQVLGGVALGMLLFKPQLALLLIGLHVLARRWRVAMGSALGAAVIWTASAAVAGSGWVTTWWAQARWFDEIDSVVNGPNAISWFGVARHLGGPLAEVSGVLLALGTAALVVLIWRDAPSRALGPPMAVAVAGALLVSPHTMFYDAGLLVLTGAVLADRLGSLGRRSLVVLWALPLLHEWDLPVTPVLVVAAVGFAVAAVEGRRPPAGDPVDSPPSGLEGPDWSIVIPAWNEADRIAPTLRRVAAEIRRQGLDAEVIVVDDGSTDDTIAVVEAHRPLFERLEVLANPTNRGKGAAVRAGMLAAVGRRRLFLDADNSTDLDQLPRLLAQGGDAPIIIGSVAVDGAEVVVRQPGLRSPLGRLGNLAIRLAVLPGVRDTQRGFKVFDGAVADDLFARSVVDRWGFDIEILGLARVAGYRVTEVGVRWEHREASRVRAGDYLATLAELVAIQARLRRLGRLHEAAAAAPQPMLVPA